MTIRDEYDKPSRSSAPLETEIYDTEVPIAHATMVEIPATGAQQGYPSETTRIATGSPNTPIAVSSGGPIFRASNPPMRQSKQVDRGCCNGHTCCCVTSIILTVFFLCCALPVIIFFIVAVATANRIDEIMDDDIWNDNTFWTAQDDLFNAINTDNAGN